MKKLQKVLPFIIIALFFIFVLYFYLHNITRDVYAGDIGDIATAAALFGVPHPPGYPLITLIGFIFSKLPIPIPVISRIALVSLLASIVGLIIFFIFVLIAAKTYFVVDKETKRVSKIKVSKNNIRGLERNNFQFLINSIKRLISDAEAVHLAVAILSTAILAFSYYYWLYAEVPEVFAMNHLILITMYFFAFIYYRTKNIIYFYLAIFFIGLSFTNQQAVMFSFPGLMVLLLPDLWQLVYGETKIKTKTFKDKVERVIKGLRRNTKVFRNLIISFIVGLLPYAYVFIAASTKPQINWLKEPTIYNFLRLLLRMDYSFADNLVDVTQRLVVQQIFFSTLVGTFSLIIVLVGVMGMIQLFFKDKRLLTALLTGFLFAGPIFIFIITPEIIDPDEIGIVERMFMQSYVLFSFFIPFGFFAIQNFFYRLLPRKIYGIIFLIPFFIILTQMIYYNYPKTDLSQTKIGSNFVRDILGPLPKNSVVFLLGDLGTLNSWYVHYVEGYRPDIVLAGSFGDRNDFENNLAAEFRAKNKKSKLKTEEIVVKSLPNILKERKVYSMYQFPLGRKGYMWVPKGLVFELMVVDEIPEKAIYMKQIGQIIKNYKIAYRDKLLPSEQNNIAPYMSKQYSNAYSYIGDFLYVRYDDRKSAFGYYVAAQIIDPGNPLSYAKMGIVQSELPGLCSQAIKNIDTSISMYKIYRPYYTFALRIYKNCDVKEEKINELKKAYKNLFGKELEKDPHY